MDRENQFANSCNTCKRICQSIVNQLFHEGLISFVFYFQHSANTSLLYCPVFNDHRFFAAYTWLYRTCLIFIPTLFAPLTYLGYNVYRMNWMINRRSKMENRPKNQDIKSKNIKKKTAQMCKVCEELLSRIRIFYSVQTSNRIYMYL